MRSHSKLLLADRRLGVFHLFRRVGIHYDAGIAIDSGGDLAFFGNTTSTNFPMVSAFQPAFCGWTQGQNVTNAHGWVAMLSPAGAPLYSTYVCGSVLADSVRAGVFDSVGPDDHGTSDVVADVPDAESHSGAFRWRGLGRFRYQDPSQWRISFLDLSGAGAALTRAGAWQSIPSGIVMSPGTQPRRIFRC